MVELLASSGSSYAGSQGVVIDQNMQYYKVHWQRGENGGYVNYASWVDKRYVRVIV